MCRSSSKGALLALGETEMLLTFSRNRVLGAWTCASLLLVHAHMHLHALASFWYRVAKNDFIAQVLQISNPDAWVICC